jgi:hypothetical protein
MELSASGYSREEQEAIYDKLLEDVIANPRWYLDNLEYMRAYQVFWKRYPAKDKLKCSPTCRYKHTKENLYI